MLCKLYLLDFIPLVLCYISAQIDMVAEVWIYICLLVCVGILNHEINVYNRLCSEKLTLVAARNI